VVVCKKSSPDERLFQSAVSLDKFDNVGGHMGIKINDQVSQNFQKKKGLQ
jgi:hypothetical protein